MDPSSTVQAPSHSSQSLFFSLPPLTFPHNNALSLMAAAPLSHFSKTTIRMNVKMEHFTSGWGPILTEDLPLAASDMERSLSGWRVASINAKKKSLWSREAGLRQIVRQFKTHIQLIIIWSVCVCLIPFLSWSQHSSVQEHFFLFQLPANPSRHGLVYVYVWGCVHVSVGVHSRRVSRDPWWWIRAGTNLLVHLWNENQGRRGQAEEGPITLASGSYTDRSWHFMVWQHTHTHRDTYTRSTPPAFSLSFCFFLDTSAQNRPDSHTNPRVACLAGHVWPRRLNGRPWMRWTHIYKRKLQLGQYHRGETFNTETLK